MPDASGKIKRLEKIVEKASKSHAHSRDIINAFTPLLIEKTRLMDTFHLEDDRTLSIDELQFKGGVPLVRQNDFSPLSDACDRIALSLLPALIKGFPKTASELEKLTIGIKEKKIGFSRFFSSTPDEGDKLIEAWAEGEGISPGALRFAVAMTGKVYLGIKARNWASLIKDFIWDKGFCPICGSAPMIAKVREKIGTRLLLCSQCGHEWTFSRVICPSCENNEQKSMTYFFVEDRKKESAFVCEKCRQYLITVDKVSDMDDFDADVSALSLVHLDVVMQEKGYRPMAECEWNTYS